MRTLCQRFGCWTGWWHRWAYTSRSLVFDSHQIEVRCPACGKTELWGPLTR